MGLTAVFMFLFFPFSYMLTQDKYELHASLSCPKVSVHHCNVKIIFWFMFIWFLDVECFWISVAH